MKASSRETVRDSRRRRRAQGWRRIEMWVPDLRKPEVAARIREQCLRIAAGEASADDLAFIESINDDMVDRLSIAERR